MHGSNNEHADAWKNTKTGMWRYRPVTSLGPQVGRRVFWEGPKFFKLCPIFLNYVQHIFPRGAKKFRGLRHPCGPPPGYGPVAVIEKHVVSGDNTTTLIKRKHGYVVLVKCTRGWRQHGCYNVQHGCIMLRWVPSRSIDKMLGGVGGCERPG